jgi:hypothetical protein
VRAFFPAFLACFAMAALAGGDDSSEVKLEYSAPSSCPGEITFRTQVSGRTSRVTFGPEGEKLVVRIVRAGGAFVGRASGAVEKEVRATTCDEVVAALAIVTSLAFEPPPEAPTPSTSTGTGTGTATATATTMPPPRPIRKSAVGVGATIGVVRDFGLDYGGFIEGSRDDLSVRLGVVHASRSVSAPFGGSLDLGLTTGRASVCPIAFGFLSPCVAGEVGALVGKPLDIPSATTARRTWAAIDLALRFTFPLGPLFAELEGYVGAPLTRDRFVVAGSPAPEEVFRAAAVRFGATFARGVRSP